MAKIRTTKDIICYELTKLHGLVNNLLKENINFETGYYQRTYPTSNMYINGPLQEHATVIMKRIDYISSLTSYLLEEENIQSD